MLHYNKAFCLDVPSHVTSFNKSDHFISACHSYITLKFAMTSISKHKKLDFSFHF